MAIMQPPFVRVHELHDIIYQFIQGHHLSVATQRTWRDEVGEKHTETEWHTVVAWDKLAEIVAQYMHNGQLVYVEGRLQTRSWVKDDVKHFRTEVIAEQAWALERNKDTEDNEPMPTEDLPL
jgi:single stranded DNA-binding protein